jgi:hypothetical protein
MRPRVIAVLIAAVAVAGCGSNSSKSATTTAVTSSSSFPAAVSTSVSTSAPSSESTPLDTSSTSAAPTSAAASATVPPTTEAPTTTVPALTGTWQSTDVGSSLFVTVSCAASNFCVAINQSDEAYTYDGSSWSAPTPADAPYNVNTVSCPSPTMCVVTDIQGGYSVFDGSTWSERKDVSNENRSDGLDGVACPTTTFCVASTDSGAAFTFDGRAWSGPTMMDPPAAAIVDAINAGGTEDVPTLHISCSSAQFCMVVDTLGSAIPYVDGGWGPAVQLDTGAGPNQLQALSCSADMFCMATGSGSVYFTFDGATWSAGQTAAQTLFGPVACSSASFCMTTGNYWSVFDGATWTSSSGSDSNGQGPSQAFALTCTPDRFCVSAGAYASVSVYTP